MRFIYISFSYFVFWCLCSKVIATEIKEDYDFDQLEYPKSILTYSVRLDKESGMPVVRGLLNKIGYDNSEDLLSKSINKEKIGVSEMKKILQCSPSVLPELNGNRGGFSLLKMAPPTKAALENIAAWIETGCALWSNCRLLIDQFKNGTLQSASRQARLIRIVDNELYIDWPWSVDKHVPAKGWKNHGLLLFQMVLNHIKIKNNVFFHGDFDRPLMPYNLPFQTFSPTSGMKNCDFIYPWRESYEDEWLKYTQPATIQNNFSDAFYTQHQTPWNQRIEKAVYLGKYVDIRRIVFDQAALRPDLIYAAYALPSIFNMKPWNPASDEPIFTRQTIFHDNNSTAYKASKEVLAYRNHPGYNQFVWPLKDEKRYKPHEYKYVIVAIAGNGGVSVSQRLANIIAHSGAVVLLQDSEFSYHFTARLKPWVHYVPFSYSASDLVERILWLKKNDHMAQQIAQNAANFGKSYLRMEDYFCYMASALDTVADVLEGSDVLEPFDMRLLM